MTESTRRRNTYKSELSAILARSEEAHKLENRYKVMAQLLAKEYPSLMTSTTKELMYEFLRDVVYIDRKIRLETEGESEDEKLELAQATAEEIRTGNY